MPSCYIKSCTKVYKNKNTKHFRLPKDEIMCKKWLDVINVNFDKIKRNNGNEFPVKIVSVWIF